MTTGQALSASGASTVILDRCRIEKMAYTALRVFFLHLSKSMYMHAIALFAVPST